ncbi:MAG: TIGR00282 family metallophosphoesterase [Patescibacteria group bacterium]
MTILMFGDIVGKIGRSALRIALPKLKEKFKPDLIIANGENAAHGLGITKRTMQALFDMGVNVITSGNHIFNKKEAIEILKEGKLPLLRPVNYPPNVPGRGYLVWQAGKTKVLIANLVGRVFFPENFDCPFRALEKILEENKNIKIVIVDAHTEATSEIRALGFYFDGKISACLGTHTHISTADAQILKNGTAYISDLGMVGLKDSIIGMEKEEVLARFLTQMPSRFVVPERGLCEICGAVIEIDEKSGMAKKLERVYEEVMV